MPASKNQVRLFFQRAQPRFAAGKVPAGRRSVQTCSGWQMQKAGTEQVQSFSNSSVTLWQLLFFESGAPSCLWGLWEPLVSFTFSHPRGINFAYAPRDQRLQNSPICNSLRSRMRKAGRSKCIVFLTPQSLRDSSSFTKRSTKLLFVDVLFCVSEVNAVYSFSNSSVTLWQLLFHKAEH